MGTEAKRLMTRTLQDDLLDLANAIAAEMYGCDLTAWTLKNWSSTATA